MAKKKDSVEFDEYNLDDLDFDALDFGDPFQEGNQKSQGAAREAVTEFVKGAAGVVKERVLGRDTIRRLVSGSLHKGYTQAFNAYDAIESGVSDVMRDHANDLQPILMQVKRRTDKWSPMAKRFLPKFLKDSMEDADFRQQAGEFNSGTPSELTVQMAGLDKLFAQQASNAADANIRDAVQQNREQKRFEAQSATQIEMGRGIGRLVGYQDTILINYHRKSLEIGYRQLDVAVRMLQLQQAHFATVDDVLPNILKNTGLPDFVKMQHTEVLKAQMAQKLASSVIGSVGNWASNFFTGVKKNASDMLGEFLQFKQMVDDDVGMGRSRAGAFGSMAGAFVGTYAGDLAEEILHEVASKLKPVLSRIPGYDRLGEGLRGTFTGVPQRINEWVKSDTNRDDMFGFAEEGLKSLFDTFTATGSIHGNSSQQLDTPAIFDNLVHRSITEVMPGYLASIDKWVRALATGEEQEEMSYSHYSGGFVSRSTLQDQHLRIALKDNSGKALRQELDGFLRDIGASDLSNEAKRAFRARLLKDMAGGNAFKPERYTSLDTWSQIDGEVANEIIEFVSETFGVHNDGTVSRTPKQRKFFNDMVEKYDATQRRVPEFGKRMQILQHVTGRRVWRDLGFSKYNGIEGDNLDLDAIYDYLINSGDDFDPAELPPKEKNALKDYLKRKKKAEEDLLRYGIGNNDKVDVDNGTAKGSGLRPRSIAPSDEYLKPTPNQPTAIDQPIVNVNIPELLKVEDAETHQRLDLIVGAFEANNLMLQSIYELLPALAYQGGDEGPSPAPSAGPGPTAGPSPRRGWALGKRLLDGAGWLAKKSAKGLGWYFGKSFKAINWGMATATKTAFAAAKFPFKARGLGVTDIFIAGSSDPVMTARDIRRGLYLDVLTKKVIAKLSDITGPVRDLRDNNLVITEQDFENGLYSGEGDSLATYLGRKAFTVTSAIAGGTAWYMRKTYGLMWSAAKKVTEVIADQFTQYDAYLPGDEEPRITSRKMARGFYRNADGSPIMSLKEIIGPVFDIDGNEVISQEEIDKFKSLYSRNGSLLFTFGRGMMNLSGRAAELAWRGAKWYGRQVGKFYRGMYRVGKSVARGIGRLFGRGMGGGYGGEYGGDSELMETSVEIQGRQLDTQLEMLRILKDSFDKAPVKGDVDGDGVREFSWKDILRRRKEAMGGPKAVGGDNSDVVEAIDNLGDRLNKQLDELIETTEEAGETSLLEDLGDIAGIRDAAGGGGGKRRRGRIKGGPKKGIMSKAWGAIATGASAIAGSTMVRSAGSLALRGLTGLGAALFSGPGLAVAAVVAGGAYLGYRYYKSEKAKEFPLLYLRMTQYGIAPTDKDNVQKMLALEEMCARSVRVGQDGVAELEATGIDMRRISSMFSLDSPERVKKFSEWVAKRFRPVYLAHVVAMKRIRNTTVLESADSGISAVDIESYLQTVDLPNMTEVYDDTDISPFEGDVDTDADDVADAFELVRDSAKKRKDRIGANTDSQQAFATTGVSAGAAAAAAAAAPKGTSIVGVTPKGTDDPSKIATGLKVASLAGLGSMGVNYKATAFTPKTVRSLNIPTAVRYKAYGLKDLELPKCVQLQQVEEVYWDVVTYNGTSSASFAGDVDALKKQVMDIFKPADEVQHVEATRWLDYRFIPVFLQYCVSVRRRYNGDARDGWRNLTGPQMKEVLEETTRATVETGFRARSIWEVLNSPWQKYDLETMAGSTKIYIDSLDTGENSKVLDVQGLETQKRTSVNNSNYGNILTNTALGNTRANPVGPGVGYNGSTLSNMAGIYSGQRTAGGQAGQGAGQGDGSMLLTGSYGNAVQHPGGGKGGDINMLPDNRGDGLEQMGPIITGAAEMVGFDPKIALNVAAAESGLRPKASSGIAFGLFQFIQGTWDAMLAKYGPTYGIAPGTPPTDPRANAILGICYLKENYQGLSGALGNNITDLDLYMSHFLGLSGAKRFLTAPRQDMAFKHVGNGSDRPWKKKGDGGNTVVGQNMSIFFKDYKSDNPQQYRNVGEILQEMDRRMNIGRKVAGNPPSATSSAAPAATSVPATPPTGGTPGGVPEMGAQNPGSGMGTGDVKEGSQAPAESTPAPTVPMAAAANVASQTTAPSGTPAPAQATPVSIDLVPPNPLPTIPQQSTAAAAAAGATQDAAVEQQKINLESTNGILEKSYLVHVSSDTLLKEIRDLLKTTGGTPPGQAAQPGQMQVQSKPQEPLPHRPLVNRRPNAVT